MGERAVVIGEMALERITAMGAQPGEVYTTLSLALCQVGRADEALAMLLEVDMNNPYPRAVRALASAMTGLRDAAVEDADLVIDDPGSTYLDRVIADVAAAVVDLANDDRDAGTVRLQRSLATAHDAGDAVARAFAGSASARFIGQVDDHEIDYLGPGWRRILDGLPPNNPIVNKETST